jgi:alpha-L-rhamnosidase
MRVVYSEAQQYLGATGDASYPDGNEVNVSFLGNPGAASLSRVNAYRPAAPGVIVNRLVQGGERFEVIQLTTPGSIALSDVGIRHLDQSPQSRVGYFESSDAALNEIWKLGARTLDLDTVPARSLPPTWSVTPQGLVVQDSAFSVYRRGRNGAGIPRASTCRSSAMKRAGWSGQTRPVDFGWCLQRTMMCSARPIPCV